MVHQSTLAQQMKARDKEMVPRVLVMAMFGLMLASLAIVAFAQLTDQPQRGVPAHSAVIAERAITLVGDRHDGVHVLDDTGTQIAFSSADRAGFIDVIWVATQRTRIREGINDNPALRLVRRANGHTAIIDPATGWSIELIGYGADNVAAFARLLE